MTAIGESCSRCVGERADMCREMFYIAAVDREGNAGTAEVLLELGNSEMADYFTTDVDGDTVPKLKRRLGLIGCSLNNEEIDVRVQERIDRL